MLLRGRILAISATAANTPPAIIALNLLRKIFLRRSAVSERTWATLVRHEGDAPREQSTCGFRDRLISREDAEGVAAWAHAVDIDGAREHYHRRSAELYYVLEGEGQVLLDGQAHEVRKGSIVHIPPGVIHGARGRMRVLVIGVPDIAEDDLFFLDEGN
jgi:mannose-6-phosphate isomerase-like protein (cupin superfamily)